MISLREHKDPAKPTSHVNPSTDRPGNNIKTEEEEEELERTSKKKIILREKNQSYIGSERNPHASSTR
jgi:hypothetical protein